MEGMKEKLIRVGEWAKTPRGKKTFYICFVVALACWVLFRFAVIGAQNRLQVFNPARDAALNGVPVEVLEIRRAPGIVREPLTVKNNRSYVSGARAALLRAGQKVGGGEIVSVSSNIDLDTGMHVVRTRGVTDGMQFAEFSATGYFVPVFAVNNGVVFVARDGVAVPVTVSVSRTDADTAYIASGLDDGDIVILSRVSAGDKIRVEK